jgi:Na+/H+ antiporter NhaB
MAATLGEAFWRNFLGQAPDWYKGLIVGCLVHQFSTRIPGL